MAWGNKSASERGYGWEWQKKRKMALRRDFGLCQCNQCGGRKKIANHVHHIVSKAEAKRRGWLDSQTDDLSNLISLNEECHDRLHGHTPIPEVGADGWAIEK